MHLRRCLTRWGLHLHRAYCEDLATGGICCAQRVTIGIGLLEATDLFCYLSDGLQGHLYTLKMSDVVATLLSIFRHQVAC